MRGGVGGKEGLDDEGREEWGGSREGVSGWGGGGREGGPRGGVGLRAGELSFQCLIVGCRLRKVPLQPPNCRLTLLPLLLTTHTHTHTHRHTLIHTYTDAHTHCDTQTHTVIQKKKKTHLAVRYCLHEVACAPLSVREGVEGSERLGGRGLSACVCEREGVGGMSVRLR